MAKKTVDHMKQKRAVSEEVKAKVKAYNKIKKQILKALEEKPKTVPEIAKEVDLSIDEIIFYLMSLRKFGSVQVDEIDDMDEYFTYKLKK